MLFCVLSTVIYNAFHPEGSQVTLGCLRVRKKKIAPQNTSASVKECVVHSCNCISSSLGGEVKASNETAGGIL